MLLPCIPRSSCIYSLGWDLLRELPPPAAALRSTEWGKRRVESNPASVVVKGKLNIPGSRTGEKDVRKIMQITSEVFSCSVLESSFCARYGDLDLSWNQKVERAVSLWHLSAETPQKMRKKLKGSFCKSLCNGLVGKQGKIDLLCLEPEICLHLS